MSDFEPRDSAGLQPSCRSHLLESLLRPNPGLPWSSAVAPSWAGASSPELPECQTTAWISKPLMEKKRRARINVSLEQLKSLLEKHYSHQIQKRKLEKADILELSVKYMKSLQNSVQGLWPDPSGAEYPSGFRRCLPGVSQFLRRGEEGGSGPRCPLVPERAGGSTMDSADPCPETPGTRGFCAPAVWAPVPVSGGSRSPPPRLLFPEGLPGPTSSDQALQPASRRCAESPGAELRVWRPW
ncbi:Transcription factor HES-3 [Manis javanica]|nr:Transcription factor HES-3 [Manis javanica]